MEVKLINYTKDAKDLLIFTKQTRRLSDPETLKEISDMTEEEKDQHLHDIFTTIRSSWEFVDYTFLVTKVTRAFTHQFVRHRIGTSFAQQSMRIAPMEGFTYLAEGQTEDNTQYHNTMGYIQHAYESMLEDDIDIQDARGILPTNIHTSIVIKMNLRALNGICNLRLCTRAHGEIQRVVKAMRDEILKVHSWAEPALLPACLDCGSCIFPRHGLADKCEVFEDWMVPKPLEVIKAKQNWEKHVGNTSPQPEILGGTK